MQIDNQINEMYIEANQKYLAREYETAKQIAYKIKSIGSINASIFASCIFIDVGNATINEKTIQDGIDLLESLEKNHIIPSLNYNLGNGYYSLYLLKYDEKHPYNYFKMTELDKAQLNFRKALNLESTAETLINLANCFDHSGRVLDAIEYYDKALDISPHHPMALGNKGLAFYNYSRLTGETGTYLVEAHRLISKALEIGVYPQDQESFLKTIQVIESLFPDKKIFSKHLKNKKCEIKGESKLEEDYIQFCLDNKLYLNICNYCQKCTNAIGDPIVIKNLIAPIEQFEENFEDSQSFQLFAYLNQIKQDYITARFLLFLSRHKDSDFSLVDKNVKLINTLDYTKYNVNIQLLKFSFKNLYDILDKISFFINDYIDLGINKRNVNFMKIWYNPKTGLIYEPVKSTDNPSLNAIFDIYKDLKPNGNHRNLKNIRNSLTHRFIKIKTFSDLEDDETMPEEKLIEHTFELAKIVRNVVTYLLNFVNSTEKKKRNEIEGVIGTLTTDEIPDDLKNF